MHEGSELEILQEILAERRSGPSRSGPPSAAASAASSSWPSATRGSRSTRRSSRPSAGASSASSRCRAPARRCSSTRCRCASSASTSRTSAAPTRSPRWSCSRAGRRRSPITARFTVRDGGPGDDYAAMAEVLSRRLRGSGRSRTSARPVRRRARASFGALPNVVVIDGGKGQLAAGLEPLQGFRDRGVAVVSLAKRIEEVFRPGAATRSCSRTRRRSCSCCSASATRRTASRSPTTGCAATAR